MDEKPFGRLLREARQRSLLTLENLAEASGVSVRAISDMERGKSVPRQATLRELMDALALDDSRRQALTRASVRRTEEVPRQLPPDPAVFRGRDEAMTAARHITSQISVRGAHVVIGAVGGMAGVGKTTLAVHWAHRIADGFPDGQLYVNLRGFEASGRPMDPEEALGRFLSALGVPSGEMPSTVEARSVLFREKCSSRRLIVVLDNARDAEQVRPLLPASAGCLTIITSRNQLSGLAASEGASRISLDVWTRDEALAALAARIGEERCGAEPEAAARLVELCGFLPLAVAIVGAQLSAAPRMALSRGVHELLESLPRLDALSTDDQQVDVRAVFSWSYRALTADSARFFRHLAVHPGPAVSTEAAASLAAVGMPTARRYLRELVSASLLSRDAEGRYVMHDLVRAYGAELLEREQDDRSGAETRLLDYLRHNAHTARLIMDTRPWEEPPHSPAPGVVQVAIADRAEAMDWFHQEDAAVTAGLHTGGDDPRLLRPRIELIHTWQSYLIVTGRWAEQLTIQRIGLDAALVLDDPSAIAKTSAPLARALVLTGQDDLVDEQVELMRAQLDRLDPKMRAHTEHNLAWVLHRLRRHAESVRHSRNALAVYRTLPQRNDVARALNDLGWRLVQIGEYQEALACCEEALPVFQSNGNLCDEAATWDSIGYARQSLGDVGGAIADYRKSLAILEEVFDPYNQADVLDRLAAAHLHLGDEEQARAGWLRAAALLQSLGSPLAADMTAKAQAVGPGPAAESVRT
ncbi:tetratricopeptide repeat protein [Streptomyces sp. HUAS MG91]|uniref:Tetratricopeptide repeat protein n=1 Tax=Streptomyces tabacisoli TaxID=3156398 RepID=A0AAU8J376_9ACTN